jgi:hypothetical protein
MAELHSSKVIVLVRFQKKILIYLKRNIIYCHSVNNY